MMTDYNVSDHWSDDDPDWLKSLVSSLDRRHGVSTVLPLTVILEEVLEWLELASGVDAWSKLDNRTSLQLDLDQSAEALGPSVRTVVSAPLAAFLAAFGRLRTSPAGLLKQSPGLRTGVAWTEVEATATELLRALDSDAAVGSSWDDLVAVARDRKLDEREYRPIAEFLYAQMAHRGLSAEGASRAIVSMVAFGLAPGDFSFEEKNLPVEKRMKEARLIASTRARVEPIVVWLGYLGMVFPELSAGSVTFVSAQWAVPNARPDGLPFEHKEELWKLVEDGILFKVAELVSEKSDVDFLVRVDLGQTTAAGAVDRAVNIVNTILNVSIHNAGGIRPHLAQYGVLQSGQPGPSSFLVSPREAEFADDHYGARMTEKAIKVYGQRIAEALALDKLPRFLAAALKVQTSADRPFSRDMALRKPSEADITSVIPLADRVVQHVAAYAALEPKITFDLLGAQWPHARWLSDIQDAVHMCFLASAAQQELHTELTREWYSRSPKQPWILFVADRAKDLLSLCRIESERGWIARMFASISDIVLYDALIDEYAAEGATLDARRRRVRNALVHGNPASFLVVESVRDYAEFLSGSALQIGLEAFVDGTTPAAALAQRTAEFTAMRAGQDAASFWRLQAPTNGS